MQFKFYCIISEISSNIIMIIQNKCSKIWALTLLSALYCNEAGGHVIFATLKQDIHWVGPERSILCRVVCFKHKMKGSPHRPLDHIYQGDQCSACGAVGHKCGGVWWGERFNSSLLLKLMFGMKAEEQRYESSMRALSMYLWPSLFRAMRKVNILRPAEIHNVSMTWIDILPQI